MVDPSEAPKSDTRDGGVMPVISPLFGISYVKFGHEQATRTSSAVAVSPETDIEWWR
jgi:hypothetical protein